jgi:hypothetical protein
LIELQRATEDLLRDKEFHHRDESASQLLAISEGDIPAFVGELEANVIFALPNETVLQSCFGKVASKLTMPVVRGRRCLSVDAPIQDTRIDNSQDCVSVVYPNGFHRTVRYSKLAGALYL